MKRILFVSVLGVFVLGLTVAMAAAENFSGTWALDYSKSQGLPENAPKDMTWTVSQTDKELTIERPGGGGVEEPAPVRHLLRIKQSTNLTAARRLKRLRAAARQNYAKTKWLAAVRA